MEEHKPVKRPGWPEEQHPGRKLSWLEWGIIIALAVVVVLGRR